MALIAGLRSAGFVIATAFGFIWGGIWSAGRVEKHGLLLPVLYALAGRDPSRNCFEIEAGLEDGGYVGRTER